MRCQAGRCGSWGEAHREELTWWRDRNRCHEYKKLFSTEEKRRDRKLTVIVTRTQRRPTLVKMR